jgi:hypothetical protein
LLLAGCILAGCGTVSPGNPVGAPPEAGAAPSTTTPPAHSGGTTTTVGAARHPSTKQPAPPHLPKGERSGVGNAPRGAPWQVPGTPEWVAAQWVTGFFEVLWDQPGPDAWAARVRPFTTPAYWRALASAVRSGPAEMAAWREAVAEKDLDQVQVLSAYRVDEAGYSALSEVVLVSYDIAYRSDANPDAPPGPAQPVFLTMVERAGRWLVSGSWSPLSQPTS